MSFCSIDSNKPLLVMEFGLGYNLDGIGDPFMMRATPTEQFSNNFFLIVLPEFATNYITVAVTPDDFEPRNIHVADALTMRMLCGTQCIALTLQFVAM